MSNPLHADLDRAFAAHRADLEALRGARLLLTGGTGFFGGWLLEAFTHAVDTLGLGAEAVVLTRDPAGFRGRRPHLAGHPAVTVHAGAVETFEPPAGRFTHVIHAATPASAKLNAERPLEMLETIVSGTRRVLEVARAAGASRFLLTSSGAVYGRQPPALRHMPEDHGGGPDPCQPTSAYGEGKRVAELMCLLHGREAGFDALVARCYAFVGPYLPIDAQYAIGNFVRDALRGGPIEVGGDGTPARSYLYGADLAAWLLAILVRGAPGRPYHVGSERDLSIRELAELVARTLDVRAGVRIARPPEPGRPPERYVPSTRRAREELGLQETFELDEAIRLTARFHQAAAGAGRG
jgi:dTDP-glucose 4,6-dehydratase